ncbi:hypothetical protein [Streptomyces sp. CC208A]|uniref:hypothetical protein n=1 Tax=Streptomyces sp. CC208A TaxID=3044573 RepID=UPI0024A97180|nr:hypothetical protein [Streptomyces sp. CC208A]
MNRRRALLPLLVAGLLALAGCGIRGSDVVEAGEAPTVVVPPIPERRMLLYFAGPDGQLMPVAREVGFRSVPFPTPTHPETARGRATEADGSGIGFEADHPYTSDLAVVKVLAALLAGPGGAERQAGLTTELPASGELIRVEDDGSGGIRLLSPFPVRELSGTAVAQLVCTTAYAVDRSGTPQVTLTGPDGALPQTTCAL